MKRLPALLAPLCAAAGLVAISSTAAAADPVCLSFQRGVLGELYETSIWGAYPDYNMGSDPEFDAGAWEDGEEQGLVGFGDDLDMIPAGSTITSATLYLWSYPTETMVVRVHRVLEPWEEMAVTWSNFDGYDPLITGTFNVVQYSLGYYSTDLTALTQQWLDADYPNYGVLLEVDQPASTSIFFRTSEHLLAYRPRYEVCYIPPAASIGSVVWFDADDDGVQDAGESGIPNVSVHLYSDADCDGVADASIGTTLTDAAGNYKLTGLDGGCYVVDVDDQSLPAGYVTSTYNTPLAVSVADGQALTPEGFGYTTLESIGDQLWLDSNLNGIFEPGLGEAGINGVTVELYDGDGVLASTVVSGNDPITGYPGYFLFVDVHPGDYTVVVAPSSFAPGGALYGLEPSSDPDGVLDSTTSTSIIAGQDFLDADFAYRLSCGNGACQDGETCGSCAIDCGACPPVCGNGTCQDGETCSNCAEDCGTCPAVCGNGTCESGEGCDECTADCGTCPAVCGDGACEDGETCSNCTEDCGTCPAVCGNGICEAGEACSTCAADCGTCPPVCGNGTCESGEACASCSSDCGTCPPPAPGVRTQGYWMNHPEAWPVQTLSLGGVVYTKAELLNILKNPVKGDVTYSMAQQLIASKLDVAAGNIATCISSTIASADQWLVTNKLGTKVKASSSAWTGGGETLKNTLDAYNNGLLCAPHGG